ncbi:MAG TPA: methyltransferase domain-containing protein [Candidatus Baltobacteraceae bacterium]
MTESSGDRLNDALRRTSAHLCAAGGVRAEYVTAVTGDRDERVAGFSMTVARAHDGLLAALLEDFNAPHEASAAVRDANPSAARAFSVSVCGTGLRYALLLGDDGWRWGDGHWQQFSLRRGFLPTPNGGSELLDVCRGSSRRIVDALLQHRLVQMGSPYWLQCSDGRVECVAVEFPWYPDPASLTTLASLSRSAPVTAIELDLTQDHVRFFTRLSATLEHVPNELAGFQTAVARSAEVERERFLREVPALDPALPQTVSAPPEIAAFDDASFESWRPVLGEGLHFHFGIFDPSVTDPDDAAMTAALRRSITDLFPFVPEGSTLYDVGCGWGGPLGIWTKERRCRALGLTPSATQYAYIASHGLAVRYGDAEHTMPPGPFDCAVFLESLEYLTHKEELLRTMHAFVKRVVMRVNCAEFPIPSTGLQMSAPSKDELRDLLEVTGWRIVHWADRRGETLPTATVWKRRMQALPPGRDEHLDKLRRWADFVTSNQDIFVRISPHIEVVADRD